MEKKDKKAPILLIIAVTMAVGSLIFILNGGGLRPLILIAKLVYFGLTNTAGEDLAAFFLVIVVFAVGAIAALAFIIPRIKLNDEKRTKIAKGTLKITQVALAAGPVVAGAVVSIKLSIWFVVPVLVVALLGSLYLIGELWLLKFRKHKRERD